MPLSRKLIRVAWMAILLGAVMEVLVLAAGGTVRSVVRDAVPKIAWSSIVCFGVALGAAAAKKRAAAMSIAGFFSAPAAFATARVLQKSLSFAGSNAASAGAGVVVLLALIKAAEYAGFGLVTGWLSDESVEHAPAYLTAGALTGLYFGGLIVAASAADGVKLLPLAVNEMIFPVGCAVVLYASRLLARA